MTAPIIDSVLVAFPAGQTSLQSGQEATITVSAHDPVQSMVTVTVTVTDSRGAASNPSTVSIPIINLLTYSATASSGTITTGSTPGTFLFTAA